MEEKNIETNEEKKGNNKIGLIIIIIFLIVVVGVGCFFLGQSTANKNSSNDENKEENKKNEEKTNTENNGNNENLLFDDNAKSQIDDFIKLAMYHSYEGTTIADALSNGLTGLTIEQKELLTYFSVSDSMVQLTSDMVPEKYKNDSYWDVSSGSIMLYQLPIQTFKDEYKRLFKEEYTIKG